MTYSLAGLFAIIIIFNVYQFLEKAEKAFYSEFAQDILKNFHFKYF